MLDPLRFFLDEHVHPGIAEGLRRRGIEAVTCQEVEMRGQTDSEILEFCQAQGYVLVTHDDDFLVIHASGGEHGGIAYCAHGSRSIGEIIRSLTLLSDVLTQADMANHVEFL